MTIKNYKTNKTSKAKTKKTPPNNLESAKNKIYIEKPRQRVVFGILQKIQNV